MNVRPALALLLFITTAASAADDIRTERVFGPETPTGRYKHPASITELDNGDLYLVYYGGDGEYAVDTAVYGSRLRKGETRWSEPKAIARNPFWSVGNGVVWQAPDGIVWLFFVTRFGETWSDSRVAAKISRDRCATWSETSMLTFEPGTMVRGRPIVLQDGSYLLPLYRETGHDTERVGADTVSFFLKFDPKSRRWSESKPIRSRSGNLQPAPAEIGPNHVVAYCRRGGGYGPVTDGYIVRAESRDGGMTWSEGVDSPFPNPNAAVDFLKLKNGHLLLVFNDSMTRRTPLAAAVSTDGDRSYPHRRNLAEGDGDYGYPVAIQTADGKIHVVYTSDRRAVVNHAVLDESAVLGRSR